MALRTPSASSLERADNCPPSHFLPRVSDVSSSAAMLGTAVHDFIVRAREEGAEAALVDLPEDAEHRMFCENLRLDRLPEGGQLEVAYAYDPQTGTARVLGFNIGRRYVEHGLKPHEVPGTADLVGVAGDTVVLIDWKTGFYNLGPAKRAWQLRFLALCACRVLGLSKARVSFWYLKESGDIFEETAELDAFDLDDIADEVKALLARLQAAEASAPAVPDVSRGPWCRFCESKEHCPGYRNLVGELVQLKNGAPLSREGRADAWMLLERVRPVFEMLDAQLRDWAIEDPIRLPDGRVVKQVMVPKETLDEKVAYDILRDQLGQQVADSSVTRKVTKKALHEAVRASAKQSGQTMKSLEEKLLSAIAKAGGLRKVHKPQIMAVKAAG
jgi:RecB family exonuclease